MSSVAKLKSCDNSNNTANNEDDGFLPTEAVCRSIQNALSNMGRALRCPLCLSTLSTDCVVLSSCAHAYCRDCIRQAPDAKCPLCQASMSSRRSLNPAPQLAAVAHAYQKTLRHFGLTPAQYEPDLAMTQLPTEEESSSSSLVALHEHVQASRTFCKALQKEAVVGKEQEQVLQANERALVARAVRQQQTKSTDKNSEVTKSRGSLGENDDSSLETKNSLPTDRTTMDNNNNNSRQERTKTIRFQSTATLDLPTATSNATTTTPRSRPNASVVTASNNNKTTTMATNLATAIISTNASTTPTATAAETENNENTHPDEETGEAPTGAGASDGDSTEALSPTTPNADTTNHRSSTTHVFAVGDIVKVQSRTWPGINKPGGVAKVVAVHANAYDVAYVLGGKERHVEAVFLESASMERSKRTSHELPKALLRQLEAEGYDVSTVSNNRKRKAAPKQQAPQKRRKLASRVMSSLATVVRGKPPRVAPERPPKPDDSATLCQLANEQYKQRLQQAIAKKVVHILPSSLSEVDMTVLCSLSQQFKKGPVKLKISESFHPTKTTLVVTSGTGKTARSRTMKLMSAALAKVPMVTATWLQACQAARRIVVPAQYIRTLPGCHTDGGVPRLVVAPHPPLQNSWVYLCGFSKQQKQLDVAKIVRQAGASVLLNRNAVAAKVRKKMPVWMVCDDEEISVPDGVANVVRAEWVFDTVASGRIQPLKDYPPKNAQKLRGGKTRVSR